MKSTLARVSTRIGTESITSYPTRSPARYSRCKGQGLIECRLGRMTIRFFVRWMLPAYRSGVRDHFYWRDYHREQKRAKKL
jgi:hypothetical protein